MIDNPYALKDTFGQWLQFLETETQTHSDLIRPIVASEITVGVWGNLRSASEKPTFPKMCEVAAEVFDAQCRKIMENVRELPSELMIASRYILVQCSEIGSDKAWDTSTIRLISSLPGLERDELLLPPTGIFLPHAIAVASAYCVKLNVNSLFFERDLKYAFI